MNGWDAATLRARIADPYRRTRHAGGSPDATELAVYAEAVADLPANGAAVVLGMTPELRRLAVSRFARLVAVDVNPAAVALYGDWLSPEQRRRESVSVADWTTLPATVGREAAVTVLGDGVFGNILSLDGHRRLLAAIAATLAPGGRFVTRHAIVPESFAAVDWRIDSLLARYRAGAIDDAEFGFCARILGFFDEAYAADTCLLDCATVYDRCDALCAAGALTPEEHALIGRYTFRGRNALLPDHLWRTLLVEAGFAVRRSVCTGRLWYDFYPLYVAEKV